MLKKMWTSARVTEARIALGVSNRKEILAIPPWFKLLVWPLGHYFAYGPCLTPETSFSL